MKCCKCGNKLSTSIAYIIDGEQNICFVCYKQADENAPQPSRNVVRWLNRLVKMKHGGPALKKLIELRISVNEQLAHDSHLVVNSKHQLGAIGLLNGALTSMGFKRIQAIYNDDPMQTLHKFAIYEE